MPAQECRLTHRCGATSLDDHVAPPARHERHASQSMSPVAIVWGDTDSRAWRRTTSRGATFSTAHVTSPDRGERHGYAGMSLHQRWSGDMHGVDRVRHPGGITGVADPRLEPRPMGKERPRHDPRTPCAPAWHFARRPSLRDRRRLRFLDDELNVRSGD
jgi:hypothetical protein